MSSSTPNKHGSGVRCLYGADKMFLEGRQERIWRNIRKIGTTHDEELKFYDWCCNRAGDPRFCDKYGQKRPKISCNGQKPSGRERTAVSRQETSSSSESEELE
ncbi:mucin-4-like [Sphaerodactylus townsendi]|uniref:mucin-4-like n=1 Tax=Sphaerodactylus townsendi TaxID=933632 RepID=UPI002026DB32|nr:mucin-4-like [Sphaerodactylus townsendi]